MSVWKKHIEISDCETGEEEVDYTNHYYDSTLPKWDELVPEDEGSEGDIPATNNKVGRNDPCPCGSGKKYKKCCG